MTDFFSSPLYPDRFWDPPTILSNGYRWGDLDPGIKKPECEADHSPPSSADVNAWNYEDVSKKSPDWPPGARTANGTVLCHL
jgi:hypothetical protein